EIGPSEVEIPKCAAVADDFGNLGRFGKVRFTVTIATQRDGCQGGGEVEHPVHLTYLWRSEIVLEVFGGASRRCERAFPRWAAHRLCSQPRRPSLLGGVTQRSGGIPGMEGRHMRQCRVG